MKTLARIMILAAFGFTCAALGYVTGAYRSENRHPIMPNVVPQAKPAHPAGHSPIPAFPQEIGR